MNALTEANEFIDKLLRNLDASVQLSSGEALELAGQITARGRAVAHGQEQDGKFREAAALYVKIATAWAQAAGKQEGEGQSYCHSLVDYWSERADATFRRASAEAAATTQPPSLLAGPMTLALVEKSQKPITRPLGTADVRRGGAPTIRKSVVPPRSVLESADDKSAFRH